MIHECAFEISGKEKRTKKGKFILVPNYKERDSSATASWYLCYLFALVSYYLALLSLCLSQYSLLVMPHWGSMLCLWSVPVCASDTWDRAPVQLSS